MFVYRMASTNYGGIISEKTPIYFTVRMRIDYELRIIEE